MISLDAATDNWMTEGAWRIAPAGVAWIKEGFRVRIGTGATVGDGATVGTGATVTNFT